MVTKQEAMDAQEFHYGTCSERIGPRGGYTRHVETWRRNGATQVWKTRPEDFRVPIKYGLRDYSAITPYNAHEFHTAESCPLLDQQ